MTRLTAVSHGNGNGAGPRALRLAPATTIDRGRAEAAAAELLAALGVDTAEESVRETPRRMADVYAELLTPVEFEPTTFPNDGGYDELVVARDIPFHSLCEHHLLPFVGVAHVGYLPGERIIGLSKLARVVELHARSLQVQERLTTQVAGWLQRELAPKGVGVVIEAEHMCMSLRGVQKPGSSTVTSALHGTVRDDARTAPGVPGADRPAEPLADLVVEREDRQVHRDHDEADDAADEDDHHRLEQRGQRLDLGVDLGLVEVGDLGQHVLELAGLLADRDHVGDHRRGRSALSSIGSAIEPPLLTEA